MTKTIDQAAVVRIVWLFVAFVLLGIGGGMIWWPSSIRIAQVRAQALDLYQQANALDEQTRRAAELRAAQRRIEYDLHLLAGGSSPGQTTAVLLRLLNAEARHDGVEFREIAPDTQNAAATTASAPATTPEDNRLTGTDVTIRLRGPFRNIVAFIADLPRHDVLLDVHDVQLTSTGRLQPFPILDASLHSTIYHLVSPASTENTHDRAVR